MSLTIAIDFDDTLTADPVLWKKFIDDARSLEHRVICVTARRETEENIDDIDEWMNMWGIELPVYFTNLKSKVEKMSSLGVKVDVWIDDNPRAVVHGVV